MENFVVSARKYRPQAFDTVVGQEHITTTLKNAIKNQQLAHAFLFCGPRGVGKTTCARILAKTINCENLQPDGEACNECTSCKSFNESSSLNIHELDAASNNSVDDIRTLVEQVRFAPQAGKYKVYIVDEVHMLSSSAFNAFLKTLEEPPHYAIFILATTEKHKILPTILSRCQIFDFKRITNKDTIHHLEAIVRKENIDADNSALHVIAEKSEGCMRDALSILDKIVSFTNGKVTYQNTLEHLNILDHDYYFKLLESLLTQDLAAAMLLYDEINRKGFEGDIFLNGFAEFIRNLMVCKNPKALSLLDVVETMHEKYQSVAQKTDLSFMLSALNILNEAEINYKTARNKRLHVELALMKLNYLQQAIELSVEHNQLVKKKRINDAVAIRTTEIIAFKGKAAPGLTPEKQGSSGNFGEAKLYIEKEAAKAGGESTLQHIPQQTLNQEIKKVQPATLSNGTTKKNLLESLRHKYNNEYNIEEVAEAVPLELTRLQQIWSAFAEKLYKQSKQSSANAFRLARLKISAENEFVVKVNSSISGGFIDKERPFISDEVQQAFANRSIHFRVEVERADIVIERPMTNEEKLQKIIDANPLVQEFMQRLKLTYR